VGDRVQVRQLEEEPWLKGTVKELADDAIKVQRGDMNKAHPWRKLLPSVIAKDKPISPPVSICQLLFFQHLVAGMLHSARANHSVFIP